MSKPDASEEALQELLNVYRVGSEAYKSLSDDVEKLVDELLARLEKNAGPDGEPTNETDKEIARIVNTLIEAYARATNLLKVE
ncbi:hypothetical protein BSFA1_42440 [Burkholderia sp. SFA1]|nr:hypothetical protein BSFA1_42440 [Burkholderia sp. SFA1]